MDWWVGSTGRGRGRRPRSVRSRSEGPDTGQLLVLVADTLFVAPGAFPVVVASIEDTRVPPALQRVSRVRRKRGISEGALMLR